MFKKKIDRLHERAARLTAKAEADKLRSDARVQREQLTSATNAKCIPNNATIKQEYVMCGQSECSHRHGLYYYAYWKGGNGRLRKKYIGKYPPEAKPINNDTKATDPILT